MHSQRVRHEDVESSDRLTLELLLYFTTIAADERHFTNSYFMEMVGHRN